MAEVKNNGVIALSLGITNCFLIPAGDNYLLVDTAHITYYSKFKQELEYKAIKLTQIKFIFLTHHHQDHTGFLADLLEESGATLIAHQKALPFLEQGINNPDMTGTTSLIRFLMKPQNFFATKNINKKVVPGKNTFIIDSDDDTFLREQGIAAKIISLPAHTNDSIALIFDNGDSFIGDAAMNILLFMGLKNRPLVAENSIDLKICWSKIKNENGKTLFVSHGKPLNIDVLMKRIF